LFRLNVSFCMATIALTIQVLNQSYAQTNDLIDETPNPLTYDQGSSLGEMLEFEKNISKRLTHQSSKNSLMSAQNENKVLSIYGVGKKLMTEVEFQGRHYQFKQGVSKAIEANVKPQQPTPTLIKIKPPCVRLRFQRVEHHFCLAGVLP